MASLRILLVLPLFGAFVSVHAQVRIDTLPLWDESQWSGFAADWLLGGFKKKAGVFRSSDGRDIVLENGLLRRTFRVSPNTACTDFLNRSNGQQLLRSVKPEARITLGGVAYNVGGLYGLKEHAYLKREWVDSLQSSDSDFRLVSYSTGGIRPRFDRSVRCWSPGGPPATGRSIRFDYRSRIPEVSRVAVSVHYELYDGIPLVCKWVTVRNEGDRPIQLGPVVHEILAVVEEESAVVGSPEQMRKQQGLYIESNYAFNNAMRYDLSDQTTHWKTDSLYRSQVNYNYQTPCLLEVYPPKFGGLTLSPGEEFESVRSYELLMDGHDRERRGLAVRRMYRTVAPWAMENPVFMHLVSRNDDEVRQAVDQCAATGYEALILSFGSHCNMEDSSAANLDRWKRLADYAHGKGVLIGGYSLFSSRRISDEDDVIDPVTGKPDAAAFFGHAPCFGSRWGLAYIEKLKRFFSHTGFDLFENDGPYPGDVCASVTHPGHEGLHDSQWRQMQLQKGLYRWLHERGVYINSPDWYFLDGTNKIAIGYRETNFSLPRDRQKVLNRQNIHDGLWEKTPSMGWGFVPLVKYQGGGPEAVLEPLSEHLADYRQLMMQYYGAGVQACYRGPRLYDTEETRKVVVDVVRWYKKYRGILNADIVHLRRADGRDWDGFLHVDPKGEPQALMMLFNPLDSPITRTIRVPLYYSGISGSVRLSREEGRERKVALGNGGVLELEVDIPAGGWVWYQMRQ
jgi:hypothetical protein